MAKKTDEREQQIADLTADLQRTRADFENYRKRMELEKEGARDAGKRSMILKFLPIIDTIERAAFHVPDDLKDNAWALGIVGLTKNLDKMLEQLGITRIAATPGTPFDPHLHEAVQAEEGEGEEVIAEELQAGYMLDGTVVRPSMVKVTTK